MKIAKENVTDVLYINNSSISQYAQCPTNWAYELGNNRTNSIGDSPALQRGTVLHDGLAAAWVAMHKGSSVASSFELGLDIVESMVQGDYKLGEDGIKMYEAYAPTLLRSGFTPLSVHRKGLDLPAIELEFQVPLEEYIESDFLKRYFSKKDRDKLSDMFRFALSDDFTPIVFRGTIDAVLQSADGTVSVVDWKTRGKMYSEQEVKYDRQLWFYYAMFSIRYPEFDIENVKQVQLLSATPKNEIQLTQTGKFSKRASYLQSTVDCYISEHNLSASEIGELQKLVKPTSHYINTLTIKPTRSMIVEQLKSVHSWTIEIARAFDTRNYRRVNNGYVCGRCKHKNICFRNF